MALGIDVINGLYRDGILPLPPKTSNPPPALMFKGRTPSPIEQRLFTMYLGYRMQPARGTFHVRSEDALWSGWSELERDLATLKIMAFELREEQATNSPPRTNLPAKNNGPSPTNTQPDTNAARPRAEKQ
jgi:hypothetical protein